jgi:hypothetical protein
MGSALAQPQPVVEGNQVSKPEKNTENREWFPTNSFVSLPLAMQELQMGGTSAVRAAGGFRFNRLPVRMSIAPSTVKTSIRSA